MRSILGECSGNVRSTPTPKDCFRTVKVSRTPEPWRRKTTPSKTWVRLRLPSITWKWTRTRSPDSKLGRPCFSWARSMLSITELIWREKTAGPRVREPRGRGMVAQERPGRSLLNPAATLLLARCSPSDAKTAEEDGRAPGGADAGALREPGPTGPGESGAAPERAACDQADANGSALPVPDRLAPRRGTPARMPGRRASPARRSDPGRGNGANPDQDPAPGRPGPPLVAGVGPLGAQTALLEPPLPHLPVVAGKQHLGHLPAAVARRAGEVRVLGHPLELLAEGLLDGRVGVAEGAGQLAHDHVGDDHRRQLAAGQHVAPDRELVVGEVPVDAVVEPLIAATEQGQVRLGDQ